ncbi:MAG TPA: peptide ABC transporter substrate-binding protein, partial [Moorella mulderi]|nr:peptide ABC transporter substrate-binding protein [Moorella mulderi]
MLVPLLLTGCGAKRGSAPALRYVLGADPETFDPALMTGRPEGTIANAIFEGLTRYDPQGKIAPG